jgi:hypothetical protein
MGAFGPTIEHMARLKALLRWLWYWNWYDAMPASQRLERRYLIPAVVVLCLAWIAFVLIWSACH